MIEINFDPCGHVTAPISRAATSSCRVVRAPAEALNCFPLQMIRSVWTRPLFALSRIFRKGLYTTTPVSFPESHGVLPTSQSPITNKPHFFNTVSSDGKQLPTYRIIDGVGNVIEGAELPEVCPNLCATLIRVLIVMLA